MATRDLTRRVLSASAATLLLAGCSAPAVDSGLTPESQHVPRNRACATPAVWVSQRNAKKPIVEGYSTGGAPISCTVNTGSASGAPFAAPSGLATDLHGNLYVADPPNYRVVAFSESGSFLANNYTLSPSLRPEGVCVSRSGILAVAGNGVGTEAGAVEFFGSPLTTNNAPTGWATGVDFAFQWCAFDKAGNFFATGTNTSVSPPVQEIVSLPAADVNLASQTLLATGISTTRHWESMYVQLPKSGATGESLAIANLADQIQFFKIDPVTGVPNPAPTSTLHLTGYPSGSNKMEQDAPSNCCYTKATVYFADYGRSETLQTKEYSGSISVFTASVPEAFGVAANPTGQE